MTAKFPATFYSIPLSRAVGDDIGISLPAPTLRRNGVAVPRSERAELLAALAAGELVELEADLEVFSQINGVRNANSLRFKPSILKRLARSYRGAPFLRDHDDRSLGARAGTVADAKAVPIEGGVRFDMTAGVTAPWAVEAMLRGNLDRFSIGWRHGGLDTVVCSECKTPVFTDCYHLPGDKLEREDDVDAVVEFVFTEAEGTELSGVSVPAVAGTGIAEIRTALSVTAATIAATATRKDDMKEIAVALGLSAGATNEAIIAAIEARSEATSALSAEIDQLRSRNLELDAELVLARETERAHAVDELFTEHAARIPAYRNAAGEPATHPVEDKLRALAAVDLEAARGILAAMPATSASALVGPAASAPTPAPAIEGEAQVPPGVAWSPVIESQLRQLGITKEQYLQYGPHARPGN